ncbi:MAG: hypothetical protein ACOC3V_05225 [bacterium]
MTTIGDLLESSLDPIKKQLSTDLFRDDKLKEKVKSEILERFFNWLEEFDISAKNVKEMAIIGSMTGYQYTETSDIDINVVVDLSDSKIKELAKLLPNGNDLTDTQHPINYYLTNTNENIRKAESVYDLLKNKWITEPDKSSVKIPYSYALEVSRFFMVGLDERINEYERDKKELDLYRNYLKDEELEINKDEIQEKITLKEEEIKSDLDSIYVGYLMLKSFRHEAYEEDYESDFLIDIQIKHPNQSINNLVYKILEQFNYFERVSKYLDIRKKYI